MIMRLFLAVALGGLIGLDRELKHRPAGLRTYMLVSLGAAIFTMISITFPSNPFQIAGYIVTGIGFLGAGSIISTRLRMHGLTTAASLWIVASIGLSVGVGQYWIALIGAGLTFVILQVKKVEEKLGTETKSDLD
jgi:putative Mg2+ transporter-C (MgtC) family protein